MIDRMIGWLESITTWKRVQIFGSLMVICLVGYASFTLINMKVDMIQSRAFKADVKVTSAQKNQVVGIIDNLVAREDIKACLVNVYQPKELPKLYADLVYIKVDGENYDTTVAHPLVETKRQIQEAPELFYQLTSSEMADVDQKDNNYLAYYMSAIACEKAQIFGLYKYGVLYGSIMIIYNDEAPHDKECLREIFVAVRSVNEVLF